MWFTLLGIAAVVILEFFSNREHRKDIGTTDEYIAQTRQDIRTVMWLLAAVVVMLGITADRIH
jgi:hypothetical protein